MVRIIFKVRDDLRQDQLVLNLLKQMDAVWKQADGVGDLHVTPYSVVPTWEDGGVVQVRACVCSFVCEWTTTTTTTNHEPPPVQMDTPQPLVCSLACVRACVCARPRGREVHVLQSI